MIPDWIIYTIGFAAQLLFSSRLLLQWIASEKNKNVTTPTSFWVHSLIASFLLFTYGYLRNDFPIMLGQIITYYIYIRNLHFEQVWKKQPVTLRYFLIAFPLLITLYFFRNNRYDLHELFNKTEIVTWLFIWGICGQVIFTFRFVYQWMAAERTKQAFLPPAFWWLSLCGSSMILVYAMLRRDPVLFVGQIFGFVVYTRNLMLIYKSEKL
ncbi:MAG: lipid-A-disaccharide synthase N-terminal domain-containing protein [Ferruginibacter sp.]|nr:lipid-A-disaccharide synthase N-terminal domain-containing protein [Ferruginibacter sp.]